MSLLNRTADENLRDILILINKCLDSRDDNANKAKCPLGGRERGTK